MRRPPDRLMATSHSSAGSKGLVWLVTGTSQGFGREIVRAALQRGDSVVATSRSPEKVASAFPQSSDRLFTLAMDLRDPADIASVVEKTLSRFGRIDALINNAGHGLLGAVEEASETEVRGVFETNVFGLLRVVWAVLPSMRERRSGRIVNMSSIGGLVGLPGFGIYNSTKFAVEGLSEALAAEVAPLGIRVILVEPGPFRTEFPGRLAGREREGIGRLQGNLRPHAGQRCRAQWSSTGRSCTGGRCHCPGRYGGATAAASASGTLCV